MKFYLKLIRWPNLLIIIFTMLLIRYGVIFPFLKIHGFQLQLSLINFILLVLSTVFIAAGGYVINDYFDRRIDMTNKPNQVIVGTHIERRKVMSLHNILTATGLALGFYLSYDIGQESFAFVFIIISGALWFYSTLYKRQLLIGNFLIALLTAIVPLLIVLYDVPSILNHYHYTFIRLPELYIEMKYMMYAVVMFSGFAFLTTFAREIIKDIQDMEGDRTCKRNTLPIVFGVNVAKSVAIFFILVTIIALSVIYFIFLQNDMLSLLYLLIALIAPMLSLVYFLIKSNSTKDYKFSSQLLKIIMVLGLLYVIPFYLKIVTIVV